MFGLLANTINADLGLIPGLTVIGPGLGFPVSVLAAFLERPFYSRAGIANSTIGYSLQANFVSHLIGLGLTLCFFCLSDAFRQYELAFFAWPFLAVGCSIWIEGKYLCYKTSPKKFRWGWAIAGNLVSASFSVGLLMGIFWARTRFPRQAHDLIPLQAPLYIFSLAGSLTLFCLSFLMVTKPRQMSALAEISG